MANDKGVKGSLGKSASWEIKRVAKSFTESAIINAYAEILAERMGYTLQEAKSDLAIDLFQQLQKWVLDIQKTERIYPSITDDERKRRIAEAKNARKKLAEKRAKEKELLK
jgi:hypothetical protein